MNKYELAENIRRFALEEAGFDLVGFSPASLPEFYSDATQKWVSDGFAGGMDYMVRDGAKRAHPEASLSTAKSVISLAVNYFHPDDPHPAEAAGKVAKYAYGADYHKIIEKKLKKLSAFVVQAAGSGTEVKSYVDTGPLLEKAFAKESGLGFFGKNTNIITREYGSWVFLACLITNIEFDYDVPHTGACGSCRLCIDACPTDALLGDYRLDARRCISYLTIEHRGAIPVSLRKKIGNRIFGCDDCQLVCPWNRYAVPNQEDDFKPRHGLAEPDLLELFSWSEAEFLTRTEGSPIRRTTYEGWLRNVSIALGNAPYDERIVAALKARGSVSEMVDEHIAWALDQQRIRKEADTC